MSRPIGLAKTGGRKAGTPNKKTLSLQESLEANDFNLVDKLLELYPYLDTDKQAYTLLQLLSYVYPKRKSVENVVNLNNTNPEEKPNHIELEDEKHKRKVRILEYQKTLMLIDDQFTKSVLSSMDENTLKKNGLKRLETP